MVMFVMVMATVSLLVGMLAVYIDGQCSDVTMPGWLRVVVRKFAQLYRLPGANQAPVRSVHASAVELTVSEAKQPQGISSEINDVLCELRFITNRLKSKDKDEEKQSQWKLLAVVVDRTLFWICICISSIYFLIFLLRADV